MNTPARRVALSSFVVLAVALMAPPAMAISDGIVISQLYGGGGNAGATYTNDFIELFNRGTVAVDIGGWSVQYASSTGTSWTNKTNIPAGTTIQPGKYFLIAEAGGAVGSPLPTADLTGSINLSGTGGKLALVNTTTTIPAITCPGAADGVVDFVGFGTSANCYEGAGRAPAPSNTTADIRGNGGCTETDNNNSDFATGTPTPRNSASPANVCVVPDVPPAVVSTNPTAGASDVPIGSNITVTFTEPVTVTTDSFTLACPATPLTFTVSGSGTATITLDPTADLPVSVACNVGVVAANVTDLDGTPDQMASPYAWTFNTASATPTLSIDDVTANEGNSGTTTFTFTVSLSAAAPAAVTFDIATADGTATTADNDYVANTLPGQTIPIGGSSFTFDVTVNGDMTFEPDQTFFVNVTNVGGANVGDGQGLGTITNDDAPTYEIWQIQGSGAASPYATQVVRTENNIVTAVGTQGFFIQTPDARADASDDTSNGIYVYTGGAPTVAVGNQVDVQGTVVEYYNFTEFQAGATVTVDPVVDYPMPAVIELDATTPPTDPADAWWTIGFERLEGMLVHVAAGVVSDGNQRFSGDTTAEVRGVMNPTRAFRATGIKHPGVAGLPIWDGNPEIIEIDADRLGAVTDPDYIAGGTTFSATGVIGFEFDDWELWPTVFTPVAPPMPRPVRVKNAGELTIGTYNLLQFNDGATNFALRAEKHSRYVRTVLRSPDVLAVQECFGIEELTALAARITQDDSNVVYTPYLLEGNYGDIDVGFLVRDTVNHLAHYQVGKDYIAPGDIYPLHDRPPFVLEAEYVGNGAPFAFTVMVNHTRSLIDVETDPDVREKRLNQAQWLAEWMQTYQTANPARPFVMVGDLNAFEFTDGYVDVIGQMVGNVVPANNMLSGPDLVDPNLTIQALSVPANDRYSYLNEGTAQVLDHALTTTFTNTWVRGFEYGRGNADAAIQYSYDAATPLRSSDHDGAVLFLMSDANGDGVPDDSQTADLSVTTVASPSPVLSGATLTYTLTVVNAGPAAAGPTTVTNTLPAGVSYVSSTGAGWACVQSLGVVECEAATMPVGTAPVLVITTTVTATSGTLTNVAEVSSFITDPNTANNTATTNTLVVSEAPAATKAATGVYQPGGTVTYTIVLTNGAATAQPDNTGDELTDVLPSSLVLVSASATSGAAVATVATNTVTWNGSIAAGSSVTITINATISASATVGQAISNQATVRYDADRDGTNETTISTDDPATGASGDPTVFSVALDASGVAVVPTVGTVGLGLLALLVALGGALLVGRRLS